MRRARENLDRYADAYGAAFKFNAENHCFLGQYARWVCRYLRRHRVQDALSLGIGHQVVCDAIAAELRHHLRTYTVLDGSRDIIARWRKAHPASPVRTVQAYFEDFRAAAKYGAVDMGFVLEHVDDPGVILKRYAGFLRPEGRIFIGVPNARSLHRLIGHEAGLLDDLYALTPYDLQIGHKRCFDLASLTRLILASGLKIVATRGLLLKPVTTDQMAQLGFDDAIRRALLRVGEHYPEIANCIYVEACL